VIAVLFFVYPFINLKPVIDSTTMYKSQSNRTWLEECFFPFPKDTEIGKFNSHLILGLQM
jgi:hypothetical protein